MPWIDHGKSYRTVALSLRAALPEDAGCVTRIGLGSAQRASLDYFAGIRTQPPSRSAGCDWRLVVDDRRRETPAGWIEHWQGHRPSDRNERWYLERRAG